MSAVLCKKVDKIVLFFYDIDEKSNLFIELIYYTWHESYHL